MYDVIIVGGGIVGMMTARMLSRYQLRVLLLEQAEDLAEGAAKANSGVLYPGFHHRGGSLKGVACVRGNAQYERICSELHVPLKRTGALYTAFHPEGEAMLLEKYHRGLENGVQGMKILLGEEARRREPLLSPRVTKAIFAPNVSVVSPFALLFALAEHALQNGVEIWLGTAAQSIASQGETVLVETSRGTLESRYVINAAGKTPRCWKEACGKRIWRSAPVGDNSCSSTKAWVIKSIMYYIRPRSRTRGALVAPTVEGNLIAGPTSEDVPSYRHTETTAKGLSRVEQVAKKLLPSLSMNDVITQFAGIRTNIVNLSKEQKDFILRESAPHVVSALGIKNPGMTAAPDLADRLIRLLERQGLLLLSDPGYQSERMGSRPFLQETAERQAALFAEDPRNARVICRCEGITEGDVLRVLRGPLPPQTLSGLKKRLRLGMGRCQGGFCTGRALALMSEYLGVPPGAILQSPGTGPVLKGKVKG